MAVPVAAPQGGLFIGQVVTSTAWFNRPNDTTTYTAGDVVADSTTSTAASVMRFAKVVPIPGGSGCIQQATISISANVAALQPDLQLYLYDVPPVMQADNAAFAATQAQTLSLIAIISFPVSAMVVTNAGSGNAGNIVCNAQGLVIPFNGNKDTDIYGHLVVRNAYVPVASTTFAVRLNVVN